MRVICCYSSNVHPKAEQALSLYAPDVEYVETKGLFGYGEAIASRWTGEDDLVVIEADKEINAETLPSFAACDKLWCTTKCATFPEPYTRITANSLSCAKFSARIQQIVKTSEFICPDPFWAPCRKCDSQGCWNQLDTRIAISISPHANGMPHVHGSVEHHHVYDDAWFDQWRIECEFTMEAQRKLIAMGDIRDYTQKG